ncbi:xyloside xylosyltransferase 1 [Elgaria multicarinata webbii]|uniref:xyloside xylosyltransferase 1 n=1 Tax=Elgaria multicarinata webbii TaxID=159646 RepID=UPI002FCD11E2
MDPPALGQPGPVCLPSRQLAQREPVACWLGSVSQWSVAAAVLAGKVAGKEKLLGLFQQGCCAVYGVCVWGSLCPAAPAPSHYSELQGLAWGSPIQCCWGLGGRAGPFSGVATGGGRRPACSVSSAAFAEGALACCRQRGSAASGPRGPPSLGTGRDAGWLAGCTPPKALGLQRGQRSPAEAGKRRPIGLGGTGQPAASQRTAAAAAAARSRSLPGKAGRAGAAADRLAAPEGEPGSRPPLRLSRAKRYAGGGSPPSRRRRHPAPCLQPAQAGRLPGGASGGAEAEAEARPAQPGVLRSASCEAAMARGLAAALRPQPCALAAAAALAVACALYYAGSGGAPRLPSGAGPELGPAPAAASSSSSSAAASSPSLLAGPGGGGAESKAKAGEELLASGPAGEAELHVLLVLAKAERNAALRAKAERALRSLVRFGKLEPRRALVLHLLSDAPSKGPAKALFRDALRGASFKHKVVFHDVEVLAEKLLPVVGAMQKLFSAGPGTYYSDSIFFLSVAMHRVMPKEISRIIQVDLDVEYRTNIRELFEEFENFPEGAVIGIAREMQPVYRHIFWQYRQEHPGTRVGEPPPDGLPGFNSGVLLLNLEAMRHSELYNRLLEPEAVRQLADRFHFKGHLGDQDFFTLAGMEHPELFHVLDCTWNRQLCTWWREHGYGQVFDRYFRCDGHVKIYHGNCNTPIPEE